MHELTAQSAYVLYTYIIIDYKDGCAILRTPCLKTVSSKSKTPPAYRGMSKIGYTPHYKLDLEFNCIKKTPYIYLRCRDENIIMEKNLYINYIPPSQIIKESPHCRKK